jgi:hypothetical protein
MTPQERERLGLLWYRIERGLFWPASQADQRTWCACFVTSLAGFWEVDTPVVGAAYPKATLSLPVPGFAIEYDLSNWAGNPQRASLRMMFEGVEIACHHIDHAFQDRMVLQTPPGGNVLANYPNMPTRNEDLLADICWVLDRYVFHPCAHLHPSPDILTCLTPADNAFRECLHEIRFGVGITNPFAALFQYRVNLVLRQTPQDTKAAKEVERNRVAGRMRDAILNGGAGQGVSAGELFGRMR